MGIGEYCSSKGSFALWGVSLRGGVSNGLVLGVLSKGLVLLLSGTVCNRGPSPIRFVGNGEVWGNILPRRRLFFTLADSLFEPITLQYRSRGLIDFLEFTSAPSEISLGVSYDVLVVDKAVLYSCLNSSLLDLIVMAFFGFDAAGVESDTLLLHRFGRGASRRDGANANVGVVGRKLSLFPSG